MTILDTFITNFTSPLILLFILGLVARLVKSDLELPEQLYQSISIYLLLAIGLKGGSQLSKFTFSELLLPLIATIAIGLITCASAIVIAYFLGKINFPDSAALGAHFGSASAVTFMAVIGFLDETNIAYPGYMTALFAVMEVPAILFAITLYSMKNGSSMKAAMHEVATGKTNLLLVGGILIGMLSGSAQMSLLLPVFENLFYGILAFFLLEMGLLVGAKIEDVSKLGFFLLGFSIIVPILHAAIGILIAHAIGQPLGGAVVLGVLASSASYIAAPAAVRVSILDANPAFYVTTSLAITFPFNITIGIPLYFWFAEIVYGVI